MMNVSLKFRKQTEYCTPQGPSFDNAKLVKFSIPEAEIQFRAPRHCPEDLHSEVQRHKTRYNPEYMTFRSFPRDSVVDDSWRNFSIFYRVWAFNGPWFTGALAELTCWVSLIKPTAPKEGVSFFHPRAFEQAVGDFITQRYAHDVSRGQSKWIAPVNLQPITTLPCVAVVLDVMPNQQANNTNGITTYLLFPVSDTCLFVMSLEENNKYAKGLLDEPDKLVDRSTMEQLTKDIMNSVKVKHTPASLAQQAKALQGLDDTSLIKEFLPMKWTTAEQDAEWEKHAKLHPQIE